MYVGSDKRNGIKLLCVCSKSFISIMMFRMFLKRTVAQAVRDVSDWKKVFAYSITVQRPSEKLFQTAFVLFT